MSHFPVVYISSDSDGSSDTEISYYSDSEFEDPGWTDYFPPIMTSSSKSGTTSTITDAASTTNPRPKKKKVVPGSSLANELPHALTHSSSGISNTKHEVAYSKKRETTQASSWPAMPKETSSC